MSLEEARRLGQIGDNLLLIGNAIAVSTDDPEVILQAAIIKLVGGLISTKAILITIELNKVIKNPIPEELNQLKYIGALLTIIGAIISTKVLYDETNLKTDNVPILSIFGFV